MVRSAALTICTRVRNPSTPTTSRRNPEFPPCSRAAPANCCPKRVASGSASAEEMVLGKSEPGGSDAQPPSTVAARTTASRVLEIDRFNAFVQWMNAKLQHEYFWVCAPTHRTPASSGEQLRTWGNSAPALSIVNLDRTHDEH